MNRKNLSMSLLLTALAAVPAVAQDIYDDIYYNPKAETKSRPRVAVPADYPSADTYGTGGYGVDRDVDEYNRRGYFGDGTDASAYAADSLAGFGYTQRIERFYNPDVVAGSDDASLAQAYYAATQPQQVNIYVDNSGYWGCDPWGWPVTRYAYPSSWYWNSWGAPYVSWTWGYGPGWGWGYDWAYGPGWGGWRPTPPPPAHKPNGGGGWNNRPGNNRHPGATRPIPSLPGNNNGIAGNGAGTRPGTSTTARPGTSTTARPGTTTTARPGTGYRPGASTTSTPAVRPAANTTSRPVNSTTVSRPSTTTHTTTVSRPSTSGGYRGSGSMGSGSGGGRSSGGGGGRGRH